MRILMLIILLLSLNSIALAELVCKSDACFEKEISYNNLTLQLKGVGNYRFFGFLVYTAAFYEETSAFSERGAGNTTKLLTIHYHRSLSPERFISSSLDVMEDNPMFDYEAVEGSIKLMNSAYRAVKEGDRYTISHETGKPFKFYYNGAELLRIQDDIFAELYFGIWLSDYSLSESLTESLRGA